MHHLPGRDRRRRAPARHGLQRRRARRARADPQRHPGRDGRLRHHRPGHRHRGDQPRGRAGPGPDAARAGSTARSTCRCRTSRAGCEILKVHASKVKCGPDVDLQRLARGTPMFSGADLAALINEAAIAATMANKDCIEQADLEEARDKVRWGRARKSRVIDEKEKEMTAYHEAGHALVQLLTPGRRPAAQGHHHPARADGRGDLLPAGEGPLHVHPAVLPGLHPRRGRPGGSPRRCSAATSTAAPPATSPRPPSSPGGWSWTGA